MRRKVLCFIVFSLFVVSTLYATELTSAEAVNYYNEGVKQQSAHNYVAADASFQKAMLLDSSNPLYAKAALNNRGIVYIQEGNLYAAQRTFEDLLAAYPDCHQARMNLGLVYEKTKSRLDSLEYWVRALELEGLKPKDFLVESGPIEVTKDSKFKK